MAIELITKSFEQQCLAFPSRVEKALAEIETVEQAKDLLDKASAMKNYAERLKAGIQIEKPIASGILKIKAKIGELLSAPSASESGKKGGRGNKGSKAELDPFTAPTIAAYRKIAKNKAKIEAYIESAEDVPTQGEFIRYCTGAHVSKNSGENEWYTPQNYIDAARLAMGGIDLDPASSKAANAIVGAAEFFTADDDGLKQNWSGRVWMNPPYSKDLIGQFAEKMAESVESGSVTAACVIVNNATETKWFQRMASVSSAICFLSGRVRFWSTERESATPLQGQAVLYAGKDSKTFLKAFKDFGFCVKVQQ